MNENDRVLEAFRNCISEPKCRDCPWKECEEMNNRKVEIPADLALAVNRLIVSLMNEQKTAHENDTFTTTPVANQHNLYVSPLYYSCKECFADLHKPMRYCWYCGRRILWNDEKNEMKTSNDHFFYSEI